MILTDLVVPDSIVHILQVQDYLRDLDNWTKQMEKKDEQLKQAKKKALSEETLKSREASPPKRSKKTEISKEKSDPEKHPNVINMDTGPVKIKGSDYAAWDKFDVEAACEEVEKDIEEEEDEEEDEEVDDDFEDPDYTPDDHDEGMPEPKFKAFQFFQSAFFELIHAIERPRFYEGVLLRVMR